jgi:hypothetical protein
MIVFKVEGDTVKPILFTLGKIFSNEYKDNGK